MKEIEKSGGGWLEPAKQFVTTCNRAGSVAWREILSPKKDFLKICGSNLFLKDTNLCVIYKKPYDFIAKSQGRPDWRTQSEPIRTAAELKVNIVLPPLLNVALYHKIREKVIALHALGMSLAAIAKSLKINEKTARKAYYYKRGKNGLAI